MSVVRFLATLVFAWVAIRATFANTELLRHRGTTNVVRANDMMHARTVASR